MAQITKTNNCTVYTIVSPDGKTKASFVPELGGAGSSIIVPFQGKDRELLFLHDCFWDKSLKNFPGGSPFLFPVCARLERQGVEGDYLYDGKIYHLNIHGFAWQMPWEVKSADSPNRLVLELTYTKATLAMYPFKFNLQLDYQVTNGQLICWQTYTNLDEKPMPYAAGFHPYFLTPPAHAGKEKVMIDFKPIRGLKYNAKLTDIVGEGEHYKVPASVAAPEVNERIAEVVPNNVTHLHFPDGFSFSWRLNGEHDPQMFKFLHTYTMADKPFICIEPWMAVPNAINTVAGMRWLAPRQSERGLFELKVSNTKSEN